MTNKPKINGLKLSQTTDSDQNRINYQGYHCIQVECLRKKQIVLPRVITVYQYIGGFHITTSHSMARSLVEFIVHSFPLHTRSSSNMMVDTIF